MCDCLYTEVLYSSKKPMVYVAPNSSLLDAFCALHGNAIHRLLVVDVLRHNPLYTVNHLLLLRFIYAKVWTLCYLLQLLNAIVDLFSEDQFPEVFILIEWELNRSDFCCATNSFKAFECSKIALYLLLPLLLLSLNSNRHYGRPPAMLAAGHCVLPL